jgi:hypothetical protein
MQALYFIDMIYNRAQPWGHYIVSEGIKDNCKGIKSSGSSTTTHIYLGTQRKNIAQCTMEGVDPTFRMFVFNGAKKEDMKQHLFVCE